MGVNEINGFVYVYAEQNKSYIYGGYQKSCVSLFLVIRMSQIVVRSIKFLMLVIVILFILFHSSAAS